MTAAAPNWKARFTDLADLSGTQWDTAEDRIKQEWEEAYTGAFIRIAVERGWKREDASSWPHEIVDEAYIASYYHDNDPERSAEADVIACEQEAC